MFSAERLFLKVFAVLCFKFIVHCPYVAVEAALLRLMTSLATRGEIKWSSVRCILAFVCVLRSFPIR